MVEQQSLREMLRRLEARLGLLQETPACCYDVTLAHCHALVEVGRRGKCSLAELAALLGLENSTVSRTVSNLARRGLMTRIIDPSDRRFVVIFLTARGEAMFHDIEEEMNRYYRVVMDHIPAEKREQVLESLALLMQAMEKAE
jgi:DNA-binding MarR family transcriptional regulator